jgi:hypothetical protein
VKFRDHRAGKTQEDFRFRKLLGFAALATFPGIRPEEIKRSGNHALGPQAQGLCRSRRHREERVAVEL